MAFTRSGVRLPLAPPSFASYGSAGRPNQGGFLLHARLLTNAVTALHDAKKPGEPNARQDSA